MNRHRIDVHHHAIPQAYIDALKLAGVSEPIVDVAYPTWDVDTDLEVMDRHGIQAAVLSITAPGVSFTDGRAAAAAARATNEALAQLIAAHPTRYGAFALLPLPDLDAALDEVDYALDVLGFDGIGLFTHYRGTYLGDPAWDRLFAVLAERDAVVFVHPTVPPSTDQPMFGLPPSLYEFPFETTRMVANLLFSGTLDRHPGLRMIVPHAGGAVPYLAKRLTYAATITPTIAEREPKALLDSLRRLYYDTAMSANDHTLAALTSFIPDDHVLFGSDYPFMPESTTAETVSGLTAYYDAPRLAQVESGNALHLLPSLAARVTGAAAAIDI
ncbi:amidohydrolase family protein [Catenulispora rubra]|uniref:amidohydrolase family protein n=1 Tax=Catenulispora rubra TaxID=280293 RepID=UPI001891F5FB|nr:amidohydrolase family protein [Catenulispora rubra]